MNLGKLTDQAKQLIGKRGGMDSVKEDAVEVKDIAQGEGSMQDKAKAAAEALKDPALRASPRTRPLLVASQAPRARRPDPSRARYL